MVLYILLRSLHNVRQRISDSPMFKNKNCFKRINDNSNFNRPAENKVSYEKTAFLRQSTSRTCLRKVFVSTNLIRECVECGTTAKHSESHAFLKKIYIYTLNKMHLFMFMSCKKHDSAFPWGKSHFFWMPIPLTLLEHYVTTRTTLPSTLL